MKTVEVGPLGCRKADRKEGKPQPTRRREKRLLTLKHGACTHLAPKTTQFNGKASCYRGGSMRFCTNRKSSAGARAKKSSKVAARARPASRTSSISSRVTASPAACCCSENAIISSIAWGPGITGKGGAMAAADIQYGVQDRWDRYTAAVVSFKQAGALLHVLPSSMETTFGTFIQTIEN